jgi:uncharacterized membrane protein
MILMFIVGIIVVIGVIVFIFMAGNKKRKGERLGEDNRQGR